VSLERARRKVVSVFTQRCVYLFAALLLLLVTVPFLEDSERGLIALNAINIIILFAAAVAVSDSRVCFVFAVVLGGSAIACQAVGFALNEPDLRVLGLGFGAAFYFMALSYLLAYVLRRDVLTVDKLYGAAAAYLMIGILWVYFYTILLRFHPGALAAGVRGVRPRRGRRSGGRGRRAGAVRPGRRRAGAHRGDQGPAADAAGALRRALRPVALRRGPGLPLRRGGICARNRIATLGRMVTPSRLP